jgi:hypothetical protein
MRETDLHKSVGSSRPNSTLTTEEIASKGSIAVRVPQRGPDRSHPRMAVAGRTVPGRNPGASARQVRLLPADSWAQRTSGGAPPLQGRRDGSSPSGSTGWAGHPPVEAGRPGGSPADRRMIPCGPIPPWSKTGTRRSFVVTPSSGPGSRPSPAVTASQTQWKVLLEWPATGFEGRRSREVLEFKPPTFRQRSQGPFVQR